ncbi:MAG: hypothetical protein ACLFTK_15320 [Anaerolineales bacterium]
MQSKITRDANGFSVRIPPEMIEATGLVGDIPVEIALEAGALVVRPLSDDEDDARWDALFASSQDMLANMAQQVRARHRAGKSTSLRF